jgi:hypothetical protein
VCTVIAILFSSAFLHFNAAIPVALLFIAAILAFFPGLLYVLRGIFVATAGLPSDLSNSTRREALAHALRRLACAPPTQCDSPARSVCMGARRRAA